MIRRLLIYFFISLPLSPRKCGLPIEVGDQEQRGVDHRVYNEGPLRPLVGDRAEQSHRDAAVRRVSVDAEVLFD